MAIFMAFPYWAQAELENRNTYIRAEFDERERDFRLGF
jgi:hypothetical protein